MPTSASDSVRASAITPTMVVQSDPAFIPRASFRNVILRDTIHRLPCSCFEQLQFSPVRVGSAHVVGLPATALLEAGYVPLPVSVIFWTLLRAESLIDNVPARVPVAVGEKVTLMVQLLPSVSLAGQSLVSAKSPVTVMLVTFSGVAPGLLTVTTCAALVVPTFRAAKVRLSGVNPISGSFSSTVAEPVSPAVVPLPVARSKPPSPLKSAATIPYGNGADVSVMPGPNVPLPSPGKMVTNPKALPELAIETARSRLPSLLKSPTTTPLALFSVS